MQVVRKLLFPFSLIYGLIIYLRNRCFDWGIFSSKAFTVKTICVGNLSVGGTGKTPMIEWLVASLQHTYDIAILSRGYKRKSKGFLLSTDTITVEDMGDEPYQLKNKFPEVAVAVDADRRNGITLLQEKTNPDVILLDDAFQHRKVQPGFSILLTAFENLYVDDWYLPTGNLRDAKGEAKRANIIVVTKCPVDLSIKEKETIRNKIRPKENQQVLFGHLAYNKQLKGNEIYLDELLGTQVTLVTGIANPEPLITFLKEEGLVFEHLKFSDHHYFTDQEVAQLKQKECILTTEKDYVRLKSKVDNLHFIEVSHSFNTKDKALFQKELDNFMKLS
ncbi:tetraacyldisaccharide 4'-kinase [Maribacter sp. LLG6340-A2]|uniref:tetraacyldisaccharide 4'-kinase n=1 Tax=Maribacter sp. LLG6340-A2 TaxID=3160834 RepID=UPI0038668ABD